MAAPASAAAVRTSRAFAAGLLAFLVGTPILAFGRDAPPAAAGDRPRARGCARAIAPAAHKGAIASAYPLASPRGPGSIRERRQRIRCRSGGVGRARGGGTDELRHRRRRILLDSSPGRRLRDHARCTRKGARRRDPRHVSGQERQSDHPSLDRWAAGGGHSRRARGVRLSRPQVRQAALEGEPSAGDPPGSRGLSAVRAPAGGDPLQARAAAAFARCGQGVLDRRTARSPSSALSSNSPTSR